MLTNNSYPRRSDHLAKLERLGMPTEPEDLLSSAMAAALLLEKGERALVLGGPGLIEELHARGVDTVTPGRARRYRPRRRCRGGTVPVLRLRVARRSRPRRSTPARASSARNEDATFPTAEGVLPGAGSLLAAVACAGRPSRSWRASRTPRRSGSSASGSATWRSSSATDPRPTAVLARRLEARFGLVLTGVTPPSHGPLDPEPDLEAPDLPHSSTRTCG